MQLGYATNRLLGRFGFQLVRTETLAKLQSMLPRSSGPQFWDLGEHLGMVRATNGNLICIDTRDTSLGQVIRLTGSWEPHVEALCRRLSNPDSIAIDVGANIGYHTAVLARFAKSVLSIEANPVTADLLRGTVALNCFRNVTVVECAAMDQPQAVEIFVREEYLGGGAVGRPSWYDDPNLAHWRRYPVPGETLDSLSRDLSGVDLIRMDIEGCELAALRGARELLSRSPGARIILEWGAYNMPAYGDVAEGLEYLAGLGFTYFARIDPDGSLARKNRAEMIDRLGMGSHEVCDVVISRSPVL